MNSTILDRARSSAKQLKRQGQMKPLIFVAQRGWQLRKNLVDRMNLRRALAKINSQPDDLPIKQWVELVIDDLQGFLKPIQDRHELTSMLDEISRLTPRTILEIGTAKGGTLFLLSKIAKKDALIVSCDLPGGLYGGGYPRWKIPVFRGLMGPGQTLQLVRGNSHEEKTRAQVLSALKGASIDFLFIDGDHSYEGVKRDFYLYRELVRPGGLIGFHDILTNRFDRDIDVARFWNEIKIQYDTTEIIHDKRQGHLGIGLVRAPNRW